MKMHRGKITLVTLAVLAAVEFLGGDYAKAESVDVVCNSPGFPMSYVSAMQVAGATEGYDPTIDSSFIEYTNPAIDFYIKNSSGNYQIDARGPNSTTDFVLEICGRGLPSTKPVNLSVYLAPAMDEDNFAWKNLIVEFYNSGDMNDPTNLLGTYDAFDLAEGTITFPQLDVNNGLSYQLLIKPRNYADIGDFNGRVNWNDFATLSSYWLTSGHDAQDIWAEYGDINRSGIVDFNDLGIFTDEWLWDANAPNTW